MLNFADAISWNQSKLSAVLHKNVTCRLRRIYADAIVCDDRARCRIDFELFGSIF